MPDLQSNDGEFARELTDDERRWIRRLERCLKAMPDGLVGFHYPGGIAFAAIEDQETLTEGWSGVERQSVVQESVSVGNIDAGDW